MPIIKQKRTTKETDIDLSVNFYGKGKSAVSTGLPFFDHMLELLAKHALLDLNLSVTGDIAVDSHHTVEDTGIVLGSALKQALGDARGIRRYASLNLPMDEALASTALDISGRPFLRYEVPVKGKMESGMDAQVFEEFFRAFAMSAGITLHIKLIYGENTHHMLEACFKGFARCLRYALEKDPREAGIPSSKGMI